MQPSYHRPLSREECRILITKLRNKIGEEIAVDMETSFKRVTIKSTQESKIPDFGKCIIPPSIFQFHIN